ncbi:nucleotide pyrophosphohydrolase [Paenibacillus alginolyticus]|uniref:Nucleotide pyrophosphohydrolase n=1 Tax=Paenibacillus alginolyticus TaxID=59839 RepID=A0ABT4GHJ6_9BACL|nr:nucleotide pyrophosphohydrolase [Paenibacillus alginolyticus]MCY9695508.1 nucleotide pyrophosphohydrolase [Paenibacillus alginolyticus]MEC0147930.1 nucleotide pyrophosphohydrolase [Paenibacillus alginolyticus]
MDSIIKKIIEFRDERDWKKFHNPKDLAISLTLEASELLENFQWKDSSEAINQNMEQIKDELADVLIYSLMIAHDLEIDVESAILNKIKKNAEKYPVDRFKGTSKKYTEE